MIQTSKPSFVYQPKRQHCTEPNDRSLSRSQDALISCSEKVLSVSCVNDNCSSSKSTLELSSKINDVDDARECSCSYELIPERVPNEMSERDKCISILKSKGVLDRVWNRIDSDSGVTRESYGSKFCEVCEHLESTENLIICDDCEDAFHVSCSSPRVTRIPVGEWLCSSCLKKKRKILNEKSSSKIDGIGSLDEGDLGSLEFMFRDREPYMTCVRIGDEFQANVPQWSVPVNNPIYWDKRLWDPAHADCAVPQELDTEEVMKQLKYDCKSRDPSLLLLKNGNRILQRVMAYYCGIIVTRRDMEIWKEAR